MKHVLDRWLSGRPLECRKVGNTLLINPRGQRDDQKQTLAGWLAPDPQHNLVVVDLVTCGPQDQAWEQVARALDREPGSFRLVFGAGSRERNRAVAQRLADRLERIVVAPDGAAIPAAGGALFVPPPQGQGWIRYQPGRPAVPDSRRFPKPRWETAVSSAPRPTSTHGVAEPLPGGMWIHDAHDDPERVHRKYLTDRVVGQENLLTVVLGAPGTRPLPLQDLVGFWRTVPCSGRSLVLFMQYGPVRVPPNATLGQELADLLDHPVMLCSGLPANVAPAGRLPEMATLPPDGAPGWRLYASGFGYLPRSCTGGRALRPVVLGDRLSAQGLPMIEPGRYQYAPDAVLEVVPSGLWVRSPDEPADAAVVRTAPADPRLATILFDETTPEASQRMRSVAEEVQQRVAPTFGERSQVMPAGFAKQLVEFNWMVRPDTATSTGIRAEDRSTQRIPVATLRRVTSEPVVPPPVGVSSAAGEPDSVPKPAPHPVATAGGPAEPTQQIAPASPVSVQSGLQASAQVPAVAPEIAPATSAGIAAAIKVESAPSRSEIRVGMDEPATMLERRAVLPSVEVTEPAATEDVAGARGGLPRVRVQPVPEPAACVVPPQQGISAERAWLRRTLTERYDEAAGMVARVVSESPGLRGPDKTLEKDAITDLAAVRLYLSQPGRQLGDAIRGGTVGPHVPVGRCAASGLRRLPSYRGASMLRATMGDSADECYPEDGLITDWSFCVALTDVHSGLPGDTNFLIWAMTARRTALLEPEVPDRVVFLPGTSFKVLRVHSGEPNVVMLRELVSSEIGEHGEVEVGPVPLDQVALAGLERAQGVLEDAGRAAELPAHHAEGFAVPPGLIIAER